MKTGERRVACKAGWRVRARRLPPLAAPGYVAAFVLLAAAFGIAYSLVLPFAATQRLGLANWAWLTPETGAFAAAFGLLFSWTLVCQAYAVRRLARSRGTGLTAAGAVAGILPAMLCCTPIVPSLVAALGASAAGVYATAAPIQAFFARSETWFLLASLALLGASAVLATRRALGPCPTCSVGGDCDEDQ